MLASGETRSGPARNYLPCRSGSGLAVAGTALDSRLEGRHSSRGGTVATQTQPLTREQLAALPDTYFKAVDAKDVDAILEHCACDAVRTVQTANAPWTGADDIRRMFTDFCDGSVSIFHEIKNIVVEPELG